MDLQKLKPWNWFKREEQQAGEVLPARRPADPLARMHQEMDRLFADFWGAAGFPSVADELMLKPSVDISETRKAYKIAVEVPGISEDEMSLTVDGRDLIIAGEKRQETEDEEEGFHRVERSYGRFRRILSLPEDADPDGISARFRDGVLKIQVPRTGESPGPGGRRIEIGR